MPRGPDALIPESVVQDIWARQMFENRHLRSTDGEKVRVVNCGVRNDGGGPDFLQAQIFIGELRWFGDVEIHVTSGIWFDHGHHLDPRYDNVILHVVLFPDVWTGKVRRSDGTTITEIILDPHISQPVSHIVARVARTAPRKLVCADRIGLVPDEKINRWVHTLARRRLLKRMAVYERSAIASRLTLLKLIFRVLGYSRNSEAMQTLFDLIAPALDDLEGKHEFEAWILGVAGLIPGTDSIRQLRIDKRAYALDLLSDYVKLSQLLTPSRSMKNVEWEFARMRPSNNPVVRVAQAAAYAFKYSSTRQWLSYVSLSEIVSEKDALKLLRQELTVYISKFFQPKNLIACEEVWVCPGRQTLDRIIVNAVAPYLMANADRLHDEPTMLGTLKLLSLVSAEHNSVTRIFVDHGIKNSHAFYSQGLHELYTFYCTRQHCLSCDIGRLMISNMAIDNADTDRNNDI